jgi:cysteine-rich repeat protein
MSRIAALAVALLTLFACKPPHVVVIVEDPRELGTFADRIAVGGDPDDLVVERLDGHTFPLRLTLTTEKIAEREVWLEARDVERVLARGRVEVAFDSARTRTFELVLRVPCGAGESGVAQCDDGLNCNGAEACVDTICEPGPPPCAPSEHECVLVECREDTGCEFAPNHSACGPIVDESTGSSRPGVCSVADGCVAGGQCSVDEHCDDGVFCNGQETCVDNVCTPGALPTVQILQDPCRVSGCSEGAGQVVTANVGDGTACALGDPTLLDGVCNAGVCALSTCGDGVINTAAGELCDDGNLNPLDLCDELCRPARFESELAVGGGMCDGQPLSVAALGFPEDLFATSDGTIYFADDETDRIRRIRPDLVVEHVAGNGARTSTLGEDPLQISINEPRSVVVASDGTIFFAEENSIGYIRRITPEGTVEAWGKTLFGGALEGFLPNLHIERPRYLTLSADEQTLFWSRKGKIILATELLTLDTRIVAGGSDGNDLAQPANTLRVETVSGLAALAGGDLLASHTSSGAMNHSIVRYVEQADGTWLATRLAGNGTCDPLVPGDALSTGLCNPRSLVAGAFGDQACVIHERQVVCLDSADQLVVRVGTNVKNNPVDGVDPLAVDLGDLVSLRTEPDGALLISGSHSSTYLLRVPADLGAVQLLKAPDVSARRCGDGLPALEAGIGKPFDVDFSPSGELLVRGENLHRLGADGILVDEGFVKAGIDMMPNGQVLGIEGTQIRLQELGVSSVVIAGQGAEAGDAIDATTVTLFEPVTVQALDDDTFYVLEREGQRLRRLDRQPDDTFSITTIAGTGVPDPIGPDGPALECGLFWPTDFAISPTGSVIIAEHEGRRLRRLTADGATLETVAVFDTTLAAVDVDRRGNAWVADTSGRIYIVGAGSASEIEAGAVPVHVAGTGLPGRDVGDALHADLTVPRDLVVDDNGDVYLALHDELAVVRLKRLTD